MVLGSRTHLRSFNLAELTEFLKQFDAPRYRLAQIMDWLHRKHVMDFSEMKNLPHDFLKHLSQCASVSALTLRETPVSKEGESVKYLMETRDGHLLESVLITQGGRNTVCVSTQLGCRMACTFCASGKGKFGRNLEAGEIVEQVSVISRHQGKPVTNVVFMGMGEPLDNYEAVMKAVEIMKADWAFGLGGRRITVSTSGITPKIAAFVKDLRGRVRLSISLHSSDQKTRSELVPISKKYKLDDLIKTLAKIHKALKREITFEYTLIQDVNDSEREARGVAKIASRLGAKVNVIPYNPIREMNYKRPSQERTEAFRQILQQKNVRVTVRQTAGRDINAACGQLRLDRKTGR